MKLHLKFICFIVIYFISNNKWVLVQSSDTSATPRASSGGVTTANPDRGQTAKTSTGTVKKTPVELDIKKSSGTNEFEYKKVDKVVTLTAKDNYAFNVVKQDNTVIWKTEKQNEYATKVVLYGKGKKEKIVTIHLTNGTKKSYKKDKNNPWREYNGPLPSTGQSARGRTHTSGGSGSASGGSPETGKPETIQILMSRHRL